MIVPHLTQLGLLAISQVVFPYSDQKLTSLNTYRDQLQAVEEALYQMHVPGYQLPPGLADGLRTGSPATEAVRCWPLTWN